MSCYLRHLEKELAEAGVPLTRENRKNVDEALHRLVQVDYKHCPDAWRAIKADLVKDRAGFIRRMSAMMRE
ncbi:MAG TPA: hypothetical protein VLH13_05505 [Methanomassiliicoccales archaeon]|nr:hypothetical protein [Methanomassiliicoccales archaeon]